MISIKEIENINNQDWNVLVEQSTTATFFQTKEWLSMWVKHFGGNQKIFGIYDDGSLIGIAPFSIKDNHIEFLGTKPVLGEELVTDYGDLIALTGKEKKVWEAIINNHQIIKLSNYPINKKILNFDLNFIREESPSFPILKLMGGKTEEVDVSPYLDLPKSWDEYLLILNRHNRHELRRKIRKLESEGAFKICYEGDPNDISEFFRLMTISNEQKRDFLSDKMKAFFQDIFDTFWSKNLLQLCFMKLNGKNIAAALVFLYKNQLLLYNSGFDSSYANLTPGLILKAYLIKYAIEHNISRLDFLRGNERYKYDLGAREKKLFKISF